MSRAASMQVLNQAFANANNAFNAYMQNDLARQKYNTSKGQWQDEYTLKQDAAKQAAFKDAMTWAEGQDYESLSKNMATLDDMAAAGHLQGIDQSIYNTVKPYVPALLHSKKESEQKKKLDEEFKRAGELFERQIKGNADARADRTAGWAQGNADRSFDLQKQQTQQKQGNGGQKTASIADIGRAVEANLITADEGRAMLGFVDMSDTSRMSEEDIKIINQLTSDLANKNKNLDSWYWTDAGRKQDEQGKARTLYSLATQVRSVSDLRKLLQSGNITQEDAQQIAKINGFVK